MAHYVLFHHSGVHFTLWGVPSEVAFYIINLHVFTVVHIFVIYNWFSSEKLNFSSSTRKRLNFSENMSFQSS